jgi:hypothetical protein
MSATLNLVTQLASAEFWYVHSEGATFGPFTPGQMDELGKQGRLGPETMVVPAGDTNWLALSSYLPTLKTIRTPTSAELSDLVGVGHISPAIAQPEDDSDGPAHAPTTFESLISSLPKTAAQTLGPASTGGCAVCQSVPIRPFEFKQNIGMLYARQVRTITGGYCRSCALATGRKTQSLTILTGWWGMISFFMNFGIIFSNAMALLDAKRMDAPQGDENPRRLSSGLPVIFRPATIGFFVVAALIYFYKFRARGEV